MVLFIIAAFRLDYEYEIEFEYDFRTSNQYVSRDLAPSRCLPVKKEAASGMRLVCDVIM